MCVWIGYVYNSQRGKNGSKLEKKKRRYSRRGNRRKLGMKRNKIKQGED